MITMLLVEGKRPLNNKVLDGRGINLATSESDCLYLDFFFQGYRNFDG